MNAGDPGISGPPEPYRRLHFRIAGVSPLVMHNGQLADPMNAIAKDMRRVSGKRAKTEADYEQLARLEFLGGLYLAGGEPCIPGEVFEAVLIEGAKKVRRGQQARAGIVSDAMHPLLYDGPRKPEDLWADERFRLVAGVRVQRNKVMRTRPIFRNWSCDLHVDYLPDHLNPSEVEEIVRIAGSSVGIGDWRPRYGRFMAERL